MGCDALGYAHANGSNLALAHPHARLARHPALRKAAGWNAEGDAVLSYAAMHHDLAVLHSQADKCGLPLPKQFSSSHPLTATMR